MFTLIASPMLALALNFVAPAEAGVHVSVALPGVHVSINPWSPNWTPAPRAGYRWIAGHYEGRSFVPGYWIPTYARAGYAWVPGYWDGHSYVEGYWRPAYNPGYVWVGGGWYNNVWYGGGWVAQAYYRSGVPIYRYNAAHIRHERAESHRERVAWNDIHDRDRYDRHDNGRYDRGTSHHESYDGRPDRDDHHASASTGATGGRSDDLRLQGGSWAGSGMTSHLNSERPPRGDEGSSSSRPPRDEEGSSGSSSRPPRDESGSSSGSSSSRPPRDESGGSSSSSRPPRDEESTSSQARRRPQ